MHDGQMLMEGLPEEIVENSDMHAYLGENFMLDRKNINSGI